MLPDLVLALAPNGAYKSKKDHQQIPISDDEIITTADNAHKLGLNMLHLHIRDEAGLHCLDAAHYQHILQRMPKDMLVQVTSEAAGVFNVGQQVQMIKTLKPKFVSIAVREIVLLGEDKLKQLFIWMCDNQVSPQLIIYDEKDASTYTCLASKKVFVGAKFPLLLVMGKGTHDINAIHHLAALTKTHAKSYMLCGFEALEHQLTDFALKHHFHLRIGFENNLTNADGTPANNNEHRIIETIKHIKNIANYQATIAALTPDWHAA